LKAVQSVSRRRCLTALAGASAALAWPRRAAAAVEFETLDLDWADATRARPVPVRLYLPRADKARARAPLVVFSHGIGGSRRGYSYLGQHFASHGVASLHLQHVGSDRQLWGGNIFSLVGRLQGAAQDTEVIHRAQDFRFALDTLLSSEWAERVDTERIVAAGHSYGANTTLLIAGARVQRDGRPLLLQDDRVRAAIVISAPPFYGQSDTRKILSGVTVPSLHVTATEDVINIPGYFSGAQDRVAVFEATASARKWLAVFEGGSHSMFTDRVGTGGVTLNPQVKAATQALTLAFVGAVLGGDGRGLAEWPQRHAGILARFSVVGA
jgi:dienelactone hydrolase